MFILAGPPGAGKTTQCKLLEERLGFAWISAGNLLRQHATGENRQTMLKGELVDDEYVDKLVDAELDKHSEDYSRVLLDGFPRDFHEARWLLEEYGVTIRTYILIEIDEQTIRQRLQSRGRADDTEQAITERIEIYQQETEHIVDYFLENGVGVARIDGSQDIENVHAQIKEAMGL